MMMRLLTLVTALCCVFASSTRADTIEVNIDFEEQLPGPLDPFGGLTYADAATGLEIRFDRVSNLAFALPPEFQAMPLEITDLGDPAFGFGNRSLSPFADTRANEVFGYLRISIDTSGLIGPAAGLELLRVDWDMGDYFPSDNDDLYIASDTGAGTLDGYVEYDNGPYAPPFGSQRYTLIRTQDITQIRMFGGTLDEANSVFYDNFSFFLQSPLTYAADEETPISSLGGGNQIDGLGPTGDGGGGGTAPNPVPEPASLLTFAAGLAVLGVYARRRRD